MNPWMLFRGRALLRSAAALVIALAGMGVGRAETLPVGVSEIIRELGELRDVSWGLLEQARKAYSTNEVKLSTLNVRYIEASAAANSLIEQFQLETAARTTMEPRRYKRTLDRVHQHCGGFTNEWHKIMTPTVRTRAGTGSSATSSTSTADAHAQLAARAVTIADGFFNLISRNRKAFRELDAQQRSDVRKLLEERKWRPLTDAASPPGEAAAGRTGRARPAGSKEE